MRTSNENLLILDNAATPTNMTSTIIFTPVWLSSIVNYSIQIAFTGSPQGNFKLQMSNDVGLPHDPIQSQQYSTVVNWTDIADSAFTVAAAGNVAWDVQNTGAEWVRAVWTPTGGSGTITVARSKVKGV